MQDPFPKPHAGIGAAWLAHVCAQLRRTYWRRIHDARWARHVLVWLLITSLCMPHSLVVAQAQYRASTPLAGDPQPLASVGALPPPLAAENESGVDLDAASPDVLTSLVDGEEIVAARTLHSAAYVVDGGQIAVVQDSLPVNYQNAEGEWQPVDPTFAAVEGGWINTRNTLQTSVAQTGSAAKIHLHEVGVGWEPQALQLADASGEILATLAAPLAASEAMAGIRSGDSRVVHYPGSWDLQTVQDMWELSPGAAAYSLRLAQAPTSQFGSGLSSLWPGRGPHWMELRVNLHLKPGTSIQVGPVGALRPASLPLATAEGIAFVSAQGETLYLQPPAAFEEGDPAQRQPGEYALRLGSTPGTVDLRVRFAWAWLSAPARQYPVILDPIFQTVSAITLREAWYTTGLVFQENFPAGDPWIGTFGDGIARSLFHFAMPTMPPGTQIERAYLVAAPTNTIGNDEYFDADVQAFALADSGWRTSATTPPAMTGNPLPIFAGAPMRFSRGAALKLPTVWDVTALATGWHANPASNHGVMLKMAQECGSCNGFGFVYPSQFSDEELKLTQGSNLAQGRLLTFSSRSGVRLVTFYQGPSLATGQRITASPPSPDPKYYHADHVYNLPALPARWQAVVVRGLKYYETEGDELETRIYNTPPLQVIPQGSVAAADSTAPRPSLRMNEEVDAGTIAVTNKLTAIEAPLYKGLFGNPEMPDYTVLNGRNFPGGAHEARVRPKVDAKADVPDFYDIHLIDEESQVLNITEFGATTFQIEYNLLTPLKIWNVNLPLNSNNRVDFILTFANDYTAQMYPGNSQAVIEKENNSQSITFKTDGSFRLSSEPFEAETTNFGLVFGTNQGYTPEGPPSPGNETVSVELRITSCEVGSLPTGDGVCQKVECPNAAFPAANFVSNVGLGMWSATGWTQPPNSTSKTTVKGAVAPLIGGPSMGNMPTVAVIGGHIMSVPNSFVEVQAESVQYRPDVVLIECQPGNETFSSYILAYRGTMSTTTHPNGQTVLYSGASNFVLFNTPWLDVDRRDLRENYYVAPIPGRMGGYGAVDRIVGPAATGKFTFNTDWNMGPQGWSTLAATVTRGATGTVPDIAGLSVDIGMDFVFDFHAEQQKFVALRGRAARISQPAQLGGASKPVQVLIFPRSLPIPSDPPRMCGFDSCLDVRSVRDTQARPDRVWDMPDIHISGEAGMMAISSGGVLQVYSRDFPDELRTPGTGGLASRDHLVAAAVNAPAAMDNLDANFSYDTFGAKVAVRTGRCVESDPTDVTIIEGATFMSLPSIGGEGVEARIASTFKLCQSTLRQVHLEFRSPVGVPLGNSGLFLTGLEGTVDIYPGHTTITLGVDIQAAPGGDGGILKVHGKVTIDTRGLFAFQGQGSVLKGIVGIDGALWVAWSPLDIGFRVSMGYPLKNPWISGMLRAHMWKGQGFANRYKWLPDNDETHIAAQASVEIYIREGAIFSWWFIDIPPADIHLGIEIAFGQFCRNSSCTDYEWGVKGKLVILGYDIGLYYTFGRNLDSPEVNPANLSFILGNDNHVLIDQYNGATDIPVGASIALAGPEALDQVATIYRSPNTIGAEDDLIPFTVNPSARQLLFGLGWQAGAPQLTLITPGGAEITPGNASQHGAEFATSLQSTLVSVQNPPSGAWQARIANLSEDGIEHYQFTYFANKGGPLAEGENILLTPAASQEDGGESYRITWRVPETATDAATISLYTTRIDEALPGTPEMGNINESIPIVQNLPLKQGYYDWDTTALPFGEYGVSGQIDDGINDAPATSSENLCDANYNPLPTLRAFAPDRFAITHVFTATGTIVPNQPHLPSTPTGLTVTPQDGALLVRWNPNPEPTITAYRVDVYWFPGQTRSYTVLATERPALRIGALENGILYEVYVAAQAVTGNTSIDPAIASETPDAAAEPVWEPPVNLSVSNVGSTSATVSWVAAPDTNPAAYRVYYGRVNGDGAAHMTEVNGTSATLQGLQTGGVYDVQVSALNGTGWAGDRSDAVRIIVTNGVDADGDGLPDDWAAAYGVHGANNDDDNDGLTNLQELEQGTDPTRQNSDGDAFSDWEEVEAGADPLDAVNYPAIFTQPRLTLGQERVRFRTKLATPGEVAPSAVIPWSNVGGGNLVLAANASASWMNVSVQGNEIRIDTLPARMSPGYHTGVVRLTAAANSDPLINVAPQGGVCIRVELWASPPDVSALEYRLVLPMLSR